MNTYHAFYNHRTVEVKAATSLEAQRIAAEKLRAKKAYNVAVVLVAKDEQPVPYSPAAL